MFIGDGRASDCPHGLWYFAGRPCVHYSLTFFATAEVISLLGAIPVFVDIDPATWNIDAGLMETAIEAVLKKDRRIYPVPEQALKRNPPVRGIMAVNLFGLPAEYSRINRSHELRAFCD